jgi:hypothetical protein
MSVAWHGEPTEAEVERALRAIDDSWPILAQSQPWEEKAKRENRQISVTFAGVLICGFVVTAWLINWLIWG